jgi:hypothetical protein
MRVPIASFSLQVLKDDDGIIIADFDNVHYLDYEGWAKPIGEMKR